MDRILLGSHKHPVNVETLLERPAEFLRADPPSVKHRNAPFPQEYRNRTCKFIFLVIIIFASGMNPYLLSERWGGSTLCVCHFTPYLLELHPLNLPQLLSVWISSAAPTQHNAEFSNLAQEYMVFLQIQGSNLKKPQIWSISHSFLPHWSTYNLHHHSCLANKILHKKDKQI